jgi:glycosyltransferase involved in cell wall biosynthesis
MARGLARAGVNVEIATTDDNGPSRLDVPLGKPIVDGKVTHRYFPRQTRFYTVSWPLMRWLARHVREYDLVHIHAVFSHASVGAGLIAGRCGVPYIVRPLGVLNRWGIMHRRRWLKQLSLRLIEKRILARAAAVHYTSEQERLEAAESGVDGPSVVLPLGIDLSRFEQLPPPDPFYRQYPDLVDRTLLLFLSRIDSKKGLDLLLPAFAAARRRYPNAALVIAGRGDAAIVDALRREAERLGIAGDVIWPGFLTGVDKLAALSAADLFVLPSYSENFGIAIVEAIAAGLPVVTSDQVGLAREIEAYEAGRVVPCDVTALTSALEAALGDADRRRRWAANGRRLVHERFSVEAMTRGLVQLYESVLTGECRA